MSLLEDAMEACVLIDKTTGLDGYGSIKTTWVDGAEFNAAIVFNSSMEARIAEKQGVTSLYTIITSRSVVLRYHDVFRRVSDGKIFRVTSDGDDESTPKSTDLDMRKCTAEEWVLTDE